MHIQTCPICLNEFNVFGSQKRTFCSRKCMSEGYKERLKGEDNPNYRHGPTHCEVCGKQNSRNADRWCQECRPRSGEANPFFGKKHTSTTRKRLSKKRKGKNYWKGRKHSQESKKKMSAYQKQQWSLMSDKDKKVRIRLLQKLSKNQLENTTMTVPEKIVHSFLESQNIDTVHNKLMYKKFFVDFWLPTENLIIEVFGDYWHGNPVVFSHLSEQQKRQQNKDRARIAYLTKCGHSVIVMWEKDLKAGLVGDLWDSRQRAS